MTDEQLRVIRELRASGCAVIVWNPEELQGVDPRDVEDRSVETGHEVIETLREPFVCKHCGEPIGEITDPWGGKHGWTHHYEDGPDAYTFCKDEEGNEAEPKESQ